MTTIDLAPIADNTLFESSTGGISNGSGVHFFAGRTNEGSNNLRRGLVKFDVAGAVPAGATINSATLTLHASRIHPSGGSFSVSLHRVLADWGEAGSNAPGEEGMGTTAQTNDATWIHRRFATQNWSSAGGDFQPSATATTNVAGTGNYQWSSAQLVADVQAWLDDPGSQFGWLVRGDEASARSAKRFDSRENPTASFRPKLTIDYTAASTNRAPTNVTLDTSSVPDKTPGATFGRLMAVDPDAGDTHTFAVSDARFEVVGGRLKLRDAQQLDHQVASSVNVDVTVTDSGTPPMQLTRTLTVTVVPVDTPFQNPIDNLDVNADRLIAPIDVLLVINFINSRAGDVSIPGPPAAPPPFVNVNGDQIIAPLDALLVINFLNFPEQGEGERGEVRPLIQEQTVEGVPVISLARSWTDEPTRVSSAPHRSVSGSVHREEQEALESALDETIFQEAWWGDHRKKSGSSSADGSTA